MRIKQGKISKWDEYQLTPLTWPFHSIFASGIRNVYDVIPPFNSMTKAYQLVTKPPTLKDGPKKAPVSSRKTSQRSVMVAMLISVHSRMSTMIGKLIGWAKQPWIKLSSLVILIRKKIGTQRNSTGNKSSKKISVWDKLFAYISLIIFAGLAIHPDVIPDALPRIAIVLLASHSIIRRFR